MNKRCPKCESGEITIIGTKIFCRNCLKWFIAKSSTMDDSCFYCGSTPHDVECPNYWRRESMISFKPLNTEGFNAPGLPIQVLIDGKVAGLIRKSLHGFRYHPKGVGNKKFRGETFPTIEQCKLSLMGE